MNTAYLSDLSRKLDTTDIDWDLARTAGLSDGERFVLTYFSDIESQTVLYLRDMLRTTIVDDADALAFLTIWNYEEHFHGLALAKVLEACGESVGADRVIEVNRRQTFGNKLRGLGPAVLAKLFGDDFTALYVTWGATQEITTLKGYERIVATTANPVLKEICERIMKQERVHFAWYFGNARKRLAASERAQRLTRAIIRRSWKPVGAGTRDESDAVRLLDVLFPGPHLDDLAATVDGKLNLLPGLGDITPVRDFVARTRSRATATVAPRMWPAERT